ncbi:hypothetical protein A5791_11745 [Mycobacterium sp. 852002-51163_SCH5372311]|nr:hypothetical protein A5791_11745 [Mycobacterium sp. 852002-51163_SCH5372311]
MRYWQRPQRCGSSQVSAIGRCSVSSQNDIEARGNDVADAYLAAYAPHVFGVCDGGTRWKGDAEADTPIGPIRAYRGCE